MICIVVLFFQGAHMKKVLVASILSASVAFAAGNTNTGCGLGSVAIQNQDSTFLQLVATTLNGTSGSQTFGISTGTSNCDQPSSIASNDKLNKFVADNMDELAIDIANGHGESLQTLAGMMNIKDTSTLQANFSKIFASSDVTSAQVIDNISTILG